MIQKKMHIQNYNSLIYLFIHQPWVEIFYWLQNQAQAVEELDHHKENNIQGVGHEEQGGEQESSQVEHQVTYHGGAEGLEQVSGVL